MSEAQQGVRIRLIVSADNDFLPIVLITNRSTGLFVMCIVHCIHLIVLYWEIASVCLKKAVAAAV